MARHRDTATADLFAVIPQPAALTPGGLACGAEIADAMTRAIKECPLDRFEIAAAMSRALNEDISVHMLNAWTAPSRDAHVPNLERAIAFCAVTNTRHVAELFVSKLGGRPLWGRDVLLAERGRIEQQEQKLRAEKREINQQLARAK